MSLTVDKLPPDKKLKKYQDSLSTYRTVKISLQKILRKPKHLSILRNYISMAHQITVEGMLFLKLYILHKYQESEIPTIDKNLISQALKIVCRTKTVQSRKNKALKEELLQFYHSHFQPLTSSMLSYMDLTQTIEFIATEIETGYHNHIKEHFLDYVNRYVNVYTKKKEIEAEIYDSIEDEKLRDDAIKSFRRNIRLIKNDILNKTLKSEEKYHGWIEDVRKNIIPQRELKENSIPYDLQCYPLDYLPGLIYMNLQIEEYDEDVKLFSPIPLRQDIKSKYIKIDTFTLINFLVEKEKAWYRNNLSQEKNNLWNQFFITDLSLFQNRDPNNKELLKKRKKKSKEDPYLDKKGRYWYRFNHTISTDGVGASIQLIHGDKYKDTRNYIPSCKKPKNYREEWYIDQVSIDFKNKKLVGIDPGKEDLIHCTDGIKNPETGRVNIFRYSQNQRRKESKSKRYRNKIDKHKKDTYIDGMSIKEIETQLSNYNHKTCDREKFKDYIKCKLEINKKLHSDYENWDYKKLKWYSFINRQRSEAKMMNEFQKKFGRGEEVIVGIGDWNQKKQIKFKEPTKGKGLRKIFRERGYELYLVDEYKTSKVCYNCGGDTEKFQKRKNPRPWKEGSQKVHGLLRCQTFPCSKLWNRDTNGALNILRLMKCRMAGEERPLEYRHIQSGITAMTPVNTG